MRISVHSKNCKKYQNKEENKMAKKKEQKDMAQEQEQTAKRNNGKITS